jgi:hypothetical protein
MRTMNWQDNIRLWRQLPAQEQLRRRLARSPEQVWQSMAFERQPVSLQRLQARHERLMAQLAVSTLRKDG